jgi:SAM-dependent methyltransferase
VRRAVSQRSGVELFSGRGHPELESAAPYLAVEDGLRAAYRQVWSRYRSDDELEVRTENHRRLTRILGGLSSSFGRGISVLDAGCGTGRYFHCLNGVERLVGMDLSPEMLAAARAPVRSEEISARQIELLCANVFLHQWPPASFDLIYSLGMFGNGCPVTAEICDRFHEWLRPGGKLFFNTVEVSTLPWRVRVRMKLRRVLARTLPKSEARHRRAIPFFAMTKRELRKLLRGSRFEKFSVAQVGCVSPLWQGVHLECLAEKT